MKKIGLIIIFFAFLFTSSCSNWLNVTPKSEIKSELMFETETGYKDALIGIYLVMAERALYGRELTVGMLDVLAQQYDLNADNKGTSYYFQRYDYENSSVALSIENAWNRAYYAVANLNNMLYYLEKNRSKLHPTQYAIFKGEALGLRAFLHFDLLRMFSYENLANNPGQLEQLSIPYVYAYEKHITKQSTVKEVLANIHKDLEEAAEIMYSADPWAPGAGGGDYELPNEDRYFTNRQKHFNYWAVVATQARVYMWEGNREKALKAATDFIENKGLTTIQWITDAVINGSETERDYTFSTEHIFQLNATKQFELFQDLIDPKYSYPNKNINIVSHNAQRVNDLFQIPEGIGTSDYRYTRLYDQSDWTFLKLSDKDTYKFRNIMPMIRMSEIYYIASECLNSTGSVVDKKTAVEYMNTVRKNRGIAEGNKLPEDITNADLTKEIEREWKKEFINEGQLFYFYKRLGYVSIPGYKTKPVLASNPVYKMPLPKTEVNVGGREDAKNE